MSDAPTPGRSPRPVVWGVALLAALIAVIGVWLWTSLLHGVSPHDGAPDDPAARPAVRAAEHTADALSDAYGDGRLTEREVRSAVAGGGVLTGLQQSGDWTSLTVAFPYRVTPAGQATARLTYLVVDYFARPRTSAEPRYRASRPGSPVPWTSRPPG
ncbi:hypothetical protein V2S66_06120 [Streptomyces sp. V4-01]|uniref:DUF4878 domain-containing protein n=1 Tax=Actinacidiphila polyblastidii TaxID=3110430 RepID=A0ABU7P6V4_9ACTN|nr:hypothetical protein [Streptomyces sp. V4-01]